MKAVVVDKYGSPEVQRLAEVPEPKSAAGEVLVRVHATTVNRTDTGFRSAKYFISRGFSGLLRPKQHTWGSEFAGEVVQLGAGVSELRVGDKVFGFQPMGFGGHAEYVVARAAGPITTTPEGWSYEQAAPLAEGAGYALNDLRGAGVRRGQEVMIYGATGAIGSAAAQIAKHMGARVTAVCGTKHVALVKTLGADSVIDYQTEDFTKTAQLFDLVFDAVGKSSYGACKRLLKPKGKYCSTDLGPGAQNPLLALWFWATGSRKVIMPIPRASKETVEYLRSLAETGAYKPLVDRTYGGLEDIVEASRYVESEQKVGNVVIRVT